MPDNSESPLTDDPPWLQDLFEIKDRKMFRDALLHTVMPLWEAQHPEGSRAKGGAPQLSHQRVREAWEKTYRELGLRKFLMLSWQELVVHIKLALGPITYAASSRKARKKVGTLYSESAIRPHLQQCLSATFNEIPDPRLLNVIRGDKKWFADLKEWICLLEAINPHSEVELSSLHGPAWQKVLHGNEYEAELKRDLAAIQRLTRFRSRPHDR